jgi:hypothetical protein
MLMSSVYVDVFSLFDNLTAYFSAADAYSNSVFQLSPEKSFPAKISLVSLLSFGHVASYTYPNKVLLNTLIVTQLDKPAIL